MQERNPRVYVAHAIAEKVAEMFAGVVVKRHPHGGWTHAEPAAPGSSTLIYRGNYPTEGQANADLFRRKREATAELMRGKSRTATDAQMTLIPE